MSGHTPGPWELVTIRKPGGRYPYRIRAPHGQRVKNVTRWAAFSVPALEEGQANAAIMTAAPDLYAALDEAVRLYTTSALVATPHEGAEDPLECGRWVNAARAAIAKAEGR